LSWADTGTAIRIRVADDGPGIPPGLQGQIFDPFFTTRKSARRSGLGLSVVQQVAEEHHARVEVSSSRWGGACFDILIPQIDS
jgi:signal transduction histidine kinase